MLIIFSTIAGKSQSNTSDFQTWSDITYFYSINNKLNIGGDLGVRGVVSKNNWNQYYFRPSLRYFFNNTIQASGGVGLFNTRSEEIINTLEVRIFEEVKLSWPTFEYIHFRHRVRIEQRFFTYEENPLVFSNLPNDFDLRARYQIVLESSDIIVFNSDKPIYLQAAWELFSKPDSTTIEPFINQNRTLIGFGHRVSPNLKYQLQYIYQKSRKLNEDGVKTTEHIIRLKINFLQRKF